MSRYIKSLGLAVLLAGTATSGMQGQTVVVGGDLSGPNVNLLALSSTATVQCVYDASFFAGVPIGSQITGLTFRMGNNEDPWPTVNTTFTDYDIVLSTPSSAAGTMSNTFASNLSGDATLVRSGPLSFSLGDFPGGSSPAFGPVIVFDAPFTYLGGDLLVQIRHTAPSGTGLAWAHRSNFYSGGVRMITDQTYAGGSGMSSDNPFVMELTYSPIPEPRAWMLLGCGLGAVLLFRRRLAPGSKTD